MATRLDCAVYAGIRGEVGYRSKETRPARQNLRSFCRFSKAPNLTRPEPDLRFRCAEKLAFGLAGSARASGPPVGLRMLISSRQVLIVRLPAQGLPPHILERANRQQCRDAKPRADAHSRGGSRLPKGWIASCEVFDFRP